MADADQGDRRARLRAKAASLPGSSGPGRRGDRVQLLGELDADLDANGPVSVVPYDQDRIEGQAMEVVRAHGLRSMDAWHVAAALLILPLLAEPGEEMAFATRDEAQTRVAAELGLTVL